MYACILHMRQNFWQFLQMGVAIQGDDAENIWKKRQISRKNGGKTSNDTETWKNVLPKDSSRAPISDGQGNVFQGMVSEKKGKKLGWIMLKI